MMQELGWKERGHDLSVDRRFPHVVQTIPPETAPSSALIRMERLDWRQCLTNEYFMAAWYEVADHPDSGNHNTGIAVRWIGSM